MSLFGNIAPTVKTVAFLKMLAGTAALRTGLPAGTVVLSTDESKVIANVGEPLKFFILRCAHSFKMFRQDMTLEKYTYITTPGVRPNAWSDGTPVMEHEVFFTKGADDKWVRPTASEFFDMVVVLRSDMEDLMAGKVMEVTEYNLSLSISNEAMKKTMNESIRNIQRVEQVLLERFGTTARPFFAEFETCTRIHRGTYKDNGVEKEGYWPVWDSIKSTEIMEANQVGANFSAALEAPYQESADVFREFKLDPIYQSQTVQIEAPKFMQAQVTSPMDTPEPVVVEAADVIVDPNSIY
jgi:hypothetical protein